MSPWVSEKHVSRPHREELINHLLSLCRIFSPSGYELGVIEYCIPILESHGFTALVSPEGNIYATRGVPDSGKYVLLNAHMDTVQTANDAAIMNYPEIVQYDKFWNIIWGRGYMIGGDDKAGVAVILTLATQTDLPMKILLTVREETHAMGANMVPPGFYDDVSFALTLDRKHCCDVINNYCHMRTAPDEIVGLVVQIAKESNITMKPQSGTYADTAVIADYVPAMNLSIGYYNAHSSDDFVRVNETYDTMMLTINCILRRKEFEDVLSVKPWVSPTPPTVSRWSYEEVPQRKLIDEEKVEEMVAKRYEKCPISADCGEKRQYYPRRPEDLIWAEGYNPAWMGIVEPGRVPSWRPAPAPRVEKKKRKARRVSFYPAYPLSDSETKAFIHTLSYLITKVPTITVKNRAGEVVTIQIEAPNRDATKWHIFGWMIFTAEGKKTTYIPLYPDSATVLELKKVYADSGGGGPRVVQELDELIRQINKRVDEERVPDKVIQNTLPSDISNEFLSELIRIDGRNFFFKEYETSLDLYNGVIQVTEDGVIPYAVVEIYKAMPSDKPYQFTPKYLEEIGMYPDYESMMVAHGIFYRMDKFRNKIEPLMARAREHLKKPRATRQVGLPPVHPAPVPTREAEQTVDDPSAFHQFVSNYGAWRLIDVEREKLIECMRYIDSKVSDRKYIKLPKAGRTYLKDNTTLFEVGGLKVYGLVASVFGVYRPLQGMLTRDLMDCYRDVLIHVVARAQSTMPIMIPPETPTAAQPVEPHIRAVSEGYDVTEIHDRLNEQLDRFVEDYQNVLGRTITGFSTRIDIPEMSVYAQIDVGEFGVLAADGIHEVDTEPPFTIEITVNMNVIVDGDNYCEIFMVDEKNEIYNMADATLSDLSDALWDTFGLPGLEDQMERLAEEGYGTEEAGEEQLEEEEGDEDAGKL